MPGEKKRAGGAAPSRSGGRSRPFLRDLHVLIRTDFGVERSIRSARVNLGQSHLPNVDFSRGLLAPGEKVKSQLPEAQKNQISPA